MPPQSGAIKVTDQLERRIRKPVDLLRCVIYAIEIFVLVVAGVAASATTTGVGDQHRRREQAAAACPARTGSAAGTVRHPGHPRGAGRPPAGPAPGSGGSRRRWPPASWPRRWRPWPTPRCGSEVAARLYDAIIMSRPGASHADALDPYLAGLVAYATIIGLSGRPGWRNALWLAIGVYGLVHLAAADTTGLSFLHHVAGRPRDRPGASGTRRAARRCAPPRRRSPPR